MGTRSVRLDEEAEAALSEIINKTGASISDAIKCSLIEYRKKAREEAIKSPAEFFKSFDLGEGGYTRAPARNAKETIKAKLREKKNKR